MSFVFQKRGSKMLARLSASVSLALGIIALPTAGGELTFSPSLTLKAYQVDISGDTENYNRQDSILAYEFLGTVDYDSRHYSSTLDSEWVYYRYSESDELNLDFVDVRWLNQWSFWEDRVGIYANYSRENDTYNTIQGAFEDRLYGFQNDLILYSRMAGISYNVPYDYDWDGILKLDFEDSDGQARNNNDNLFSQLDSSTLSGYSKIGQYEKEQPVYWYADLTYDEFFRDGDSLYRYYETYGEVRLPIYERLHLAATGYYGENVSTYLEEQNLDGGNTKLRTNGLGLAWEKNNTSFVQITHEWNHSDNTTFWAGNFSWQLFDRWQAQWRKQKRVYGDVETGSLSYTNGRHQFSATHEESVELRRQIQSVEVGSALYVCDVNDEGEALFDDEFCFIPDALNYTLETGQFTITTSDVVFPVIETLVFSEVTKASWAYNAPSKWSHTADWEWRKERNIEAEENTLYGFNQQEFNFSFKGTWRVSALANIVGDYRFEKQKFIGGEVQTYSRLFRLAYERDLNRNSEYSVGLQYNNFDGDRVSYSFDDARIFATFTYHFGKKNKRRRELLPAGK
jgi:hypothetical protein